MSPHPRPMASKAILPSGSRGTITWLLTAACALLLAGCLWTTRAEGDALEKQTATHEQRLAALEEGMQEERGQLRAEVERAQQKVAELEGVLEQATQVVTRNSADLGLEVEGLRGELATLEGRIAELGNELEQARRALEEQREGLEQRLETFARRAGVDLALDESAIPAEKEAHLAAAEEAFEAGEHSKARALYREYLNRYPRDEKADDAQYRLGASYLAQSKPATALGELRKVISNHGEGDAVDDALLSMAEAFYQLHSCDDAKAALQALIRSHGQSPLVRRARQKLRTIERAPSSQCTR